MKGISDDMDYRHRPSHLHGLGNTNAPEDEMNAFLYTEIVSMYRDLIGLTADWHGKEWAELEQKRLDVCLLNGLKTWQPMGHA